MTDTGDVGGGWRVRAVERSLRTARERAVSRSERFISVATEILYETGSLDFTVQDLVERSQMSLRSFYQHFASKDDLLLAVFEEAIRSFVAGLRAVVDAEPDPLEKLRLYVTGFYGAGERPSREVSAALSRFLLTVTSAEPSELARVLGPQIDLLAEIVAAGVAAGRLRGDVPASSLTLLITHTLMSSVQMHVIGGHLTGEPLGAEDLWAFCRAAVAPPAGQDSRVMARSGQLASARRARST